MKSNAQFAPPAIRPLHVAAIVALALILALGLGLAYYLSLPARPATYKPDPVIAPPDEQARIIISALESFGFMGVLPPIEGPDDLDVDHVILMDGSRVLCPFNAEGDTESFDWHCNPTQVILSALVDPRIPYELRADLVAANRHSQAFPAFESESVILRPREEVLASLGTGHWGFEGFYSLYPNAAGYMDVSMPVMSADGKHALLYAEGRCGYGFRHCGSGALIYMMRSGDGWEAADYSGVWR